MNTAPHHAEPHASRPRILIVDDDESALRVLTQILARGNAYDVQATQDPRQALPRYRDVRPDLIMLDLHMPGFDGFAVLQQLRVRVPEDEFLPILIVSGDLTPAARQKALALGASDFIGKPFEMIDVQLRVQHLLRIRELNGELNRRLQSKARLLQDSEIELASRLALMAELGDYGDGDHVQRVGRSAAAIADRLGMDQATVRLIRHAAPLHDIGKTAIPDAILLKRDELSLDEWDVMKTHTTIGARMLTGSSSVILQMAEEVALYHHENWNGTGYTPGLGGEDIPLVARIVTAADVFDALTHDRPYKAAWTTTRALQWIESMSGTKFDPAVVDALVAVLKIEDLTTLPHRDFEDDYYPEISLPLLEPMPARDPAH